MDIRGLTVHEVWVEKASDIAAEYYAAVVFDRSAKKPLVMLSAAGGMEIEEVAEEKIARLHVDPLVGFLPFHGRRLAFDSGIDADVIRPVGAMLAKLYDVFVKTDSMLVEVNPLIVTGDRQVIALDAKVTVDDNALPRQPEVAEMRNPSAEDPQEQMAKERGITYVKLDGEIGILGNGAGLVMSTLDVVAQAGGRPANFLDVGGGAEAEEIVTGAGGAALRPEGEGRAVQHLRRDHPVRRGRKRDPPGPGPDRSPVPIVVRLDGTNDEEGRRILAEADAPQLHPAKTMLEAAEMVVRLARRAGRESPRRRADRLSHPRRPGHEAGDLGADRPPGPVPRQAQQGLRHGPGGRRHPGEGRRAGRRRPGVQHDAQGRCRDGRQHGDGVRAAPVRRGCDLRGGRRRHRHDHLHHRGNPRARHAAGLQLPARHGHAADRAQLSRRAVSREGERRHHPGGFLLARRRGPRVAIGDAHVPDRLRAGPARASGTRRSWESAATR